MLVYTISKLAEDAGVSAHVVRDYQMRGILKPCDCMDCGYSIYDESALNRLRFVRAGKEAGVSLNDLAKLCLAIADSDSHSFMKMRQLIEVVLKNKRHQLDTFTDNLMSITEQ